MAHFQLKLGVIAEGGQVVRGKGVPQNIRLPVGEAGFPVQASPETPPVRRTNPLVLDAPDALQDACQRREDGDVSGAASLAVARGDADDAGVESYIAPAQAFHLIRAHARVEHDGCRGEAGAALEDLGGVQESSYFLFVQDADALFFNAFRLHLPHRVLCAPAPLARRGEDSTEDESCIVPLARCVECFSDVVAAFLGGDAAHAAICQFCAALHEPLRDATEVAQRSFPSIFSRFQRFLHGSGKGDRLFAPSQFFLPCRDARHSALHASPSCFQRGFRHQCCFQHIHTRLPQHLYRCQLRRSIGFCFHSSTYLEFVCK